MKTVSLDMWELLYKEGSNELRLFVNSMDASAVLFSLTPGNIDAFLETMMTENADHFVLPGQAMVPVKSTTYFIDYGDVDGEYGYEETELNYTLRNDDLSAFKVGEVEDYKVELDEETRRMFVYTLWQEASLEWLSLPQ